MENSRLNALKSILEQDPGNAFVRYGLAQEYLQQGDLVAAVQEFRALIEAKPDYVASYFHCGQALERLDRVADARRVYESGIGVCTRTGDTHTRSEIQAALDLLPE